MNTNRKAALAVGIVSLLVSLVAEAGTKTAFAFGPIEQLNSRSVTVLGQSYSLNNSSSSWTQLSLGTYVLVEGVTDRKGLLAARSIKVAKNSYVPGASDVALSGTVSRYDETTGILTIGSLSIYAIEAVAANRATVRVGAEVEIVGRQAAPFGLLWAADIRALPRNVESTGLAAQSIEGTGISAQSIEGTGRSAQSIEGTGISAQSIEGTGRSAQSIEGTGRSTQSIEGTGISAQSIEGTGRSAQSIEGTGRLAQSIEGTGISAQSIEGTGRSVQSIEGTGISAQSIEGTGRSVQSIEGTGISAQSIEGTGRSAQSIEGTGISAQSIEGTGRAAL